MNADELHAHIQNMGGLGDGTAYHLPPLAIDDALLREAWRHLRLQWQRFEQELYAFEAILDGNLGTNK